MDGAAPPSDRWPQRRRRSALVVAAAAVAAAGVLSGAGAALAGARPDAPCSQRIVAEVLSPDEQHVAVVSEDVCAAPVGASTAVHVMSTGWFSLDDLGELPDASVTHPTPDPTGNRPGPGVQVRWNGPDELRISYPEGTRIAWAPVATTDVALTCEAV